MNTWNSEEVRARYDGQTLGFLTEVDGKTRLQGSNVAMAFRELVLEEGADPKDPDTLVKARQNSSKFVSPVIMFETITWVTFTMMLSELGKKKELADILEDLDNRMNPTWESGGLYYPRNDGVYDDDWNLIHMERHSGNSGIAYARLNVEDGQKKMWEKPWTREILQSRPFVDGVTYADGVDFLRGVWDENARAMIVTLRSWSGDERKIRLQVKNLPKGDWDVYVNGRLSDTVHQAEFVEVAQVVGAEEVDIIVAGI